MRTIERSTVFKRDYKRIKATPRYRKDLESLSGNWHGYRECHIKPDLLLIYSKPDQFTLRLARLGSHGELFD
jgi:mRNA interferase YafQ